MTVHQRKIGLKSLDKINWQGKTILDIGCGDGTLSLEVLKKTKCNKLIGIDISEEKIERTKKLKKDKLEFLVANVSKLPFNNESFDSIFCNIAFHLFEDKKKALEEIYRVLKQKGEVIINYIEIKSDVLKNLESILLNLPFNRFVKIKSKKDIKISKKEFYNIVRKIGFSKIDVISKNDLIYYKTLSSLLKGYKKTIDSKIEKLPEELKKKAKEELNKKLKLTKTEKGFPEKWKIVFARLVK